MQMQLNGVMGALAFGMAALVGCADRAPERPANLSEAQAQARAAVASQTGRSVDAVECTPDVDIGDGHRYFECAVSLSDAEAVLVFLQARAG